MDYPSGAIKSYEELCKIKKTEYLYEASKRFRMVSEAKLILSISFACLRDMNIPANGYNDWYLFTDRAKALAYAESKT